MAYTVNRAGFLRRTMVGGGSLVAAGTLVSAFAPSASGLAAPDVDLAGLRLLIGTELLALDFQAQALASGKLSATASAVFKKMRADEQAHYNGLADLLLQAGQTPATSDDIDFSYPAGSFGTEAAIVRLADELEALQLGAYIGANADVQTPRLRIAIGQIAASEAQHAAALAGLAGKPVIGRAFGPALRSDAVTVVLDNFES